MISALVMMRLNLRTWQNGMIPAGPRRRARSATEAFLSQTANGTACAASNYFLPPSRLDVLGRSARGQRYTLLQAKILSLLSLYPRSLGLGGARLSRKFFRKLRYGRERPKVDESCGRGSSLGLQFCTGEQNFAFPGSKKSQFLEKSRSARARKPNPYLKKQDFV